MRNDMTVQVLCFAQAREASGFQQQAVTLPTGTTAEDLLEQLAATHEKLGPLIAVTCLAINQEYATATQVLQDGDEVALIPPVSGG